MIPLPLSPSTAALGPAPLDSVALHAGPVSALLLAGALLLSSTAPGRQRLAAFLPARPVTPAAEQQHVPVLRPAWALVGAVAMGALGWAMAGPATGVVTAGAVWAAGTVTARRLVRRARPDGEIELAGCWELIAVCLRAGLPVSVAVAAAAEPLEGEIGGRLRQVSGLLELGADPAEAWRSAAGAPALAPFARAAARSAGTGAALAQVADTEAARLRSALTDSAHARAQRAAVLITGPLGLCFLPSFLVLGIGPVVIGLAGAVLTPW